MTKLTFSLLLSLLALPLLVAGCSMVDPQEDAIRERRSIGDEAEVQTLAGAMVNTPDAFAGDGDEVRLEEGQSVALQAFDATLTFAEKLEDSRCPTNVTCVWEGQAKIVLTFARSGQAPVSFEMTGFVGPNGAPQDGPALTQDAFGLRFTLLRLDPYPLDGIDQTDPVTATIRVEAL